MYTNYLKIMIRNLFRHRGFAFINIFGLEIGLCCCLLISIYVVDALSYDRLNEHYNEIYRVVLKGRFANEEMEIAVTPAPMAFTAIEH